MFSIPLIGTPIYFWQEKYVLSFAPEVEFYPLQKKKPARLTSADFVDKIAKMKIFYVRRVYQQIVGISLVFQHYVCRMYKGLFAMLVIYSRPSKYHHTHLQEKSPCTVTHYM